MVGMTLVRVLFHGQGGAGGPAGVLMSMGETGE